MAKRSDKTTMTEVEYRYNAIYLSPATGRYYFVAKVRMLPNGLARVVGKKHDVTESIEALLPKKRPAKRKKGAGRG